MNNFSTPLKTSLGSALRSNNGGKDTINEMSPISKMDQENQDTQSQKSKSTPKLMLITPDSHMMETHKSSGITRTETYGLLSNNSPLYASLYPSAAAPNNPPSSAGSAVPRNKSNPYMIFDEEHNKWTGNEIDNVLFADISISSYDTRSVPHSHKIAPNSSESRTPIITNLATTTQSGKKKLEFEKSMSPLDKSLLDESDVNQNFNTSSRSESTLKYNNNNTNTGNLKKIMTLDEKGQSWKGNEEDNSVFDDCFSSNTTAKNTEQIETSMTSSQLDHTMKEEDYNTVINAPSHIGTIKNNQKANDFMNQFKNPEYLNSMFGNQRVAKPALVKLFDKSELLSTPIKPLKRNIPSALYRNSTSTTNNATTTKSGTLYFHPPKRDIIPPVNNNTKPTVPVQESTGSSLQTISINFDVQPVKPAVNNKPTSLSQQQTKKPNYTSIVHNNYNFNKNSTPAKSKLELGSESRYNQTQPSSFLFFSTQDHESKNSKPETTQPVIMPTIIPPPNTARKTTNRLKIEHLFNDQLAKHGLLVNDSYPTFNNANIPNSPVKPLKELSKFAAMTISDFNAMYDKFLTIREYNPNFLYPYIGKGTRVSFSDFLAVLTLPSNHDLIDQIASEAVINIPKIRPTKDYFIDPSLIEEFKNFQINDSAIITNSTKYSNSIKLKKGPMISGIKRDYFKDTSLNNEYKNFKIKNEDIYKTDSIDPILTNSESLSSPLLDISEIYSTADTTSIYIKPNLPTSDDMDLINSPYKNEINSNLILSSEKKDPFNNSLLNSFKGFKRTDKGRETCLHKHTVKTKNVFNGFYSPKKTFTQWVPFDQAPIDKSFTNKPKSINKKKANNDLNEYRHLIYSSPCKSYQHSQKYNKTSNINNNSSQLEYIDNLYPNYEQHLHYLKSNNNLNQDIIKKQKTHLKGNKYINYHNHNKYDWYQTYSSQTKYPEPVKYGSGIISTQEMRYKFLLRNKFYAEKQRETLAYIHEPPNKKSTQYNNNKKQEQCSVQEFVVSCRTPPKQKTTSQNDRGQQFMLTPLSSEKHNSPYSKQKNYSPRDRKRLFAPINEEIDTYMKPLNKLVSKCINKKQQILSLLIALDEANDKKSMNPYVYELIEEIKIVIIDRLTKNFQVFSNSSHDIVVTNSSFIFDFNSYMSWNALQLSDTYGDNQAFKFTMPLLYNISKVSSKKLNFHIEKASLLALNKEIYCFTSIADAIMFSCKPSKNKFIKYVLVAGLARDGNCYNSKTITLNSFIEHDNLIDKNELLNKQKYADKLMEKKFDTIKFVHKNTQTKHTGVEDTQNNINYIIYNKDVFLPVIKLEFLTTKK